MSVTDCLNLNKSELFCKVRAGLPVSLQTQNLLDCSDDLLFVWDALDSCLLVTNWRAATLAANSNLTHKKGYQTLIPSSSLNFEVQRVSVSNEGSLVALSGTNGLAIMEVPKRWGSDGNFMDNKDKIFSRVYNLDAILFKNNPQLEVRQLRWHPESATDSHLLVLLTNNTIRMYNHKDLRHVWQVGPTPQKSSANTSLSDFGETAVDFDIAPAVKHRNANQSFTNNSKLNQSKSLKSDKSVAAAKTNRIEWPIVILRENGNIYVLVTGIDSEKSRLQGPITISPQTQDNYGLESCSIMIIPSLPPTIVMAESNGKLHHALLLEAENVEHSFSEVDNQLLIEPSEWTLHVLETVELELGLPKPTEINFNCAIHLKRDLINELRYFAYHNAGMHVISVNFISELQRFLDSEAEDDILTLSTPSQAEYILCTKLDASSCNPVLGIALLQMPAGIVLLLGSGQVISLKLIIDAQLLLTSNKGLTGLAKTNEVNDSQQGAGTSFVDTIKALLQRSVNQPILSADRVSIPSPHERYELLNQAMQVLRAQYLKRHELVRNEFAKRINGIRLQKEQQLEEIKSLEQEREVISERAHKLAERLEEISENQETLGRKCNKLMQLAHSSLPNSIVAEREFAQEIKRINVTTKSMSTTLDKAKKSINKQRYHIAKSHEAAKRQNYELPERQHSIISEILTNLTIEINNQITDVKRMKKLIGLN